MAARIEPEAAMRMALRLAERGEGRCAPNPSVGAVVFRGSEVLGRGTTRPPPGPHAEVMALRDARRRVGERRIRGASMAVSLEPCSHQGRTGPCTRALIDAGITRVHVGCRDPHAAVSGRGLSALRRAGLEVTEGVLEREARHQHRSFLSVCARGRPWMQLKLASTLDGRIATAGGESRWISGERARAAVHALRAHSDAVLVGSGTALADDPRLTVRSGQRTLYTPIRVLADSGLRVPTSAALFRDAPERTWVLCAPGARGRKARTQRGARVLETPRVPGARRGLAWMPALERLASEGLTRVFVEGGGRLAAELLRAGCIDEIHWFTAPRLLGGDARPALGPLALERLADAVEFVDVKYRRLGDDQHLQGLVAATDHGFLEPRSGARPKRRLPRAGR